MQDAGALRGADIGSDQTLVLAKMKLRKTKRNGKVGTRVDMSKPKDPIVMKSFR